MTSIKVMLAGLTFFFALGLRTILGAVSLWCLNQLFMIYHIKPIPITVWDALMAAGISLLFFQIELKK